MDTQFLTRTRVGIVGAGRAGLALGRALAGGGAPVVAVQSRGEDGRRRARSTFGIAASEYAGDVLEAGVDVLLLGVSDDAVASIAAELAELEAPPTTVVLLSGSVPLAQLEPLGARGHAIARLQPLHPCTLATSPEELVGSFATIGGTSVAAIDLATRLAIALGMRPVEVADDALAGWHASASAAANHVTALLAMARDIAVGAGVEERVALEGLATLAAKAATATAALSPEDALTGPVARGDAATVARQLDAVERAAPGHVRRWRAGSLDALELAGTHDRRLTRAIAGLPADGLAIVADVDALRRRLAGAREAGLRVGFVPTMGALHDGHAALVRRAREECDVVVVSCFVNPTQFGPTEDLDRYPRTPEVDERVVEAAGGDVLWRPRVEDVYGPDPAAATRVRVGPPADILEGAARPGHFEGVASVVVRLVGAVAPEALYLGAKDFQQVAVLRRVIADLAIELDVRVVDTVRDVDGLALSSRNAYLTPAQRRVALAIPSALERATALVASGERSARAIRHAVLQHLDAQDGLDVDYVEVRDARSLAERDVLGGAPAVVLVAARVGSTRLIDNVVLEVHATLPARGAEDAPCRTTRPTARH